MWSKVQKLVPIVVMVAMVLALGMVMAPQVALADGEPYLEIVEGTVLWQESESGDEVDIEAELVADLDGDGLPDVLVYIETGPWDNRTETVIAKRGSDGTHLWEESVSGYEASIGAEVVGDLDGDGLPDVLVNSWVGPSDDPTDTVIAKKGNTGYHLWEESITGYSAYIDAEVVADLDGDGLPDVVV
ncbi:MAG: VCBS repeat-containing protein, partial [Chloroflexi bacterium]|nr:VCBS repeat-containing protein [Chloroflexota bacterium]